MQAINKIIICQWKSGDKNANVSFHTKGGEMHSSPCFYAHVANSGSFSCQHSAASLRLSSAASHLDV